MSSNKFLPGDLVEYNGIMRNKNHKFIGMVIAKKSEKEPYYIVLWFGNNRPRGYGFTDTFYEKILSEFK